MTIENVVVTPRWTGPGRRRSSLTEEMRAAQARRGRAILKKTGGPWKTLPGGFGHRITLVRLCAIPLIFGGILIPAFAAVTSTNAQERIEGQSGAGSWVRTTKGCQIWASDPQTDPKVIWSGQCVNGRVSGYGIMDHLGSSGVEHYEGYMLLGKMNGQGVARLGTGGTLSGEWHDGEVQGIVTFQRSDGFRYKGSWVRGEPSGFGVATWPSGSSYEGEWRDHGINGSGVMTDPSGTKFEGQFRNGRRSGRGTIQFTNGTRIEGNWDGNLLSGRVSSMDSNGNLFEGTINDLKREGEGTYTWKSGDRYEGGWRDNVPDGQGTLTKVDGTKFSGPWKHGCFRDGDQHAFLFVKEGECAQ